MQFLDAFIRETLRCEATLDRVKHLRSGLSDQTGFKDYLLLALDDQAVLLPHEVARILIFEVVQVLAEKFRSFVQDSVHLLSRCVDQDHLGYVDDVCLIRLLCQVPLIDVERLQIDR